MSMKKVVGIGAVVFIIIMSLSLSRTNSSELVKDEDLLALEVEDNNELSAIQKMNNHIKSSYIESELKEEGLGFDVFRQAYIGLLNLQSIGKTPSKSSVLSIADFTLSSKEKRLWIVDVEQNKLLLNTWVAHGKGSGNSEMATTFSNIPSSHQSSLGFYTTGEIYYGKNGRSMKLDGLDEGFNTKARERYIVLHGAYYVSPDTIKSLDMLGLSEGCPAVPMELSNKVIDMVKDKSVIYIYANSPDYKSKFLNEEIASNFIARRFKD